jgi:hypothetical protein
MPSIGDLAVVDETVADGDILPLHNISKGTNLKDQGLSITKLRADAFLGRANTWGALQTFDAGISLGNETLSVYDEGTWTPTDDSGAGLTLTAPTGRFTRIGRMVFAEFSVVYPTTASGVGAAIGGLPFTPLNLISTTRGGGFLMGTTAGLSFISILVTASSNIQFMDGSFAAYTNANLSGKVVRGTVIYTV